MISKLKEAYSNPRAIGEKVNRIFYSRYGDDFNERGLHMFDADWDNLVILDACRDDTFQKVCDFPGETKTVESCGAMTREWVHANVVDRDLSDVVYVSANSWYLQSQDLPATGVHDYVNLQEEEFWDDDALVCLPETVTEQALETAARYPNKRLLVHFVQPHDPFIRSARRLLGDCPRNVYKSILNGDLEFDRETLREAYEQNLREAIPAVEDLIDGLEGKTVVSSDHGEMLGEFGRPFPVRGYGHTSGLYYPELVMVPWHELPCEERREISKGRPVAERFDFDQAQGRKRLADLGYL